MEEQQQNNIDQLPATQLYKTQLKSWPRSGKHIIGHYTNEGILVYQAYNREIAKYALEHQKFEGCKVYSESRMTWIKTNFMWMMFRSGWGHKNNQEHILGIWLKREAFEKILMHSRMTGHKKPINKNEPAHIFGTVRLQWDPDHGPSGNPISQRRDIQLGLKKVNSFINGNDIIRIIDMTNFVHQQSVKKLTDELEIPYERVYPVSDEIAKLIEIDKYLGSQEIVEHAGDDKGHYKYQGKQENLEDYNEKNNDNERNDDNEKK